MSEESLGKTVTFIIKSLRGAQHQPLVEKYINILNKAKINYEEADIQEAFNSLNTDFDRVCFILKKLEEFHKGMPSNINHFLQGNLKSDALAKHLLARVSNIGQIGDDADMAFGILLLAYFHAESEKMKAEALLTRSRFLYKINCFLESLDDAKTALGKFELSSTEMMELYANMARCYVKLDCPVEAETHFKKALKCTEGVHDVWVDQQRVEILKDQANLRPDCIASYFSKIPPWRVNYPSPPQTLNRENVKNPELSTKKTKKKLQLNGSDLKCELIAVNNGVLRLKNSHSDHGCRLEATRDISTGEVLVKEKPYASVMLQPRTDCCYYCYRRCLNIEPCNGCAQVGFCSAQCAKDAGNPECLKDEKPGNHIYDCGGMLPCLQLDDLFKEDEQLWSESRNSFSHLAYTCIANTPPNTLLDHLCTTGRYKKLGVKHQAFVSDDAPRSKPPLIFDPSDYSSVAWLDAETHKFTKEDLWRLTVKAIFLTFCLSIAGYPMKWFREAKKHFYEYPSPSNRPSCIPASWVAACILYHLKAVQFNALPYVEKKGDDENVIYAQCIYPTLSLLNHSCNPSASIVNVELGGAFAYALRSIKSGEEVHICYGFEYAEHPAPVRRRSLQIRYRFKCLCEACCNLWLEEDRSLLIKCPSCRRLNVASVSRCHRCKDKSISCIYKLLEEDTESLSGCFSFREWHPESVYQATAILEQYQAILTHPSELLSWVTEKYKNIVARSSGVTSSDILAQFNN